MIPKTCRQAFLHTADPQNFTLFLQLLDRDAYADVKSIHEAMEQRRAPFYLRRTKETMVYFPELQPDGKWNAKPVFTKRIPRTANFSIDGPELELYQKVTRFVETAERPGRCTGRRPSGSGGWFPDVVVPEASCLEHVRLAAFAREPGQASGG